MRIDKNLAIMFNSQQNNCHKDLFEADLHFNIDIHSAMEMCPLKQCPVNKV